VRQHAAVVQDEAVQQYAGAMQLDQELYQRVLHSCCHSKQQLVVLL
jgi:hypothetical protein